MIILELMGGLGNQLYQYAFYKKLISMGKKVKIDLSRFNDSDVGRKDKRTLDLDKLEGVCFEVCSLQERQRYHDDNRSFLNRVRRKLFGSHSNIYSEIRQYDPEVYHKDNICLRGYFRFYKYYEEILDVLKAEIQFPESRDTKNLRAEALITNTDSVSIHIRRGDYLEGKNSEIFGNICTEEYYHKSIEIIEKSVGNPHYFVFSDDPEFAGEFTADLRKVTLVDWNHTQDTNIYDMKLMSLCKHNLCANSTFSIWAALLNKNENAIKIQPYKSTNLETEEELLLRLSEKKWIFIDENGNIRKNRKGSIYADIPTN